VLRVKFFVIPTLGRDLKFEANEEKSFARELTRICAKKRIGSWFSLALPIKTIAGFSFGNEFETTSQPTS
jgi:hypothetical protein